MTAFVADNLLGLAVLVGGAVITVLGFLLIVGRPKAPKERDDETPTNPKGKP